MNNRSKERPVGPAKTGRACECYIVHEKRMKFIVTDNSGSGKTWFANNIASSEMEVIHLDKIFWKSSDFNIKRGKAEVDDLIIESLTKRQWVVEGVFGELIDRYIKIASVFILLDMPWELCRERLEKRLSESKIHISRTQSSERLKSLNDWDQLYYKRSDLRSKLGHHRLFENFRGKKLFLDLKRKRTTT